MLFKSWEEVQKFQNEIAKIMVNSHRLNRISHSYIFEGANGTKKKSTAFLFAKSLLCTNPNGFNPCNECHSCRRIDNLTHPNLFYIKPQGKIIKKNQIQSLLKEFSKVSIEKGPRIYIIEDADKLNQTSANTLLKTMEEPGVDIYQILVTESINSLLRTIVSRAEVLHFKPLDRDIIKKQLIENDISQNIANAISKYTVDMESAIKIAKDEIMISIINLVIDIHNAFLIEKASALLIFKEHSNIILNNIKFIDFFLSLMIFYEKDILNYQLRHFDELCFSESDMTIKELSKKMSQKHIEENLAKMLGLKSRLKYNINNTLAFNKMLVCLERGYKYGTYCSSNTI